MTTADEGRRRLVHVGGAAFPLSYLLGALTWPQLQQVYLVGTVLAVSLEVIRLVVGLDWRLFRRLTREYERSNPAGYALYTVSSTIVVWAFEPRIAVPAVLMLAIADPISGLLSQNEFPEPKRPVVLAVTFLVCAGLAIPFLPLAPALFGAVTATAADGFTPVVAGYVIDDNATIPIGAGVAMWAGIEILPAAGIG